MSIRKEYMGQFSAVRESEATKNPLLPLRGGSEICGSKPMEFVGRWGFPLWQVFTDMNLTRVKHHQKGLLKTKHVWYKLQESKALIFKKLVPVRGYFAPQVAIWSLPTEKKMMESIVVNWRKMIWDDQPILLVVHICIALGQDCSQTADKCSHWHFTCHHIGFDVFTLRFEPTSVSRIPGRAIAWSQQRSPVAVLRIPVFCTLKWSPSAKSKLKPYQFWLLIIYIHISDYLAGYIDAAIDHL